MKLNLDIEIDSQSGFCFGVKEAIRKAEDVLSQGKKLYCLGQIVHNQEEIKRLEDLGMVTIDLGDIEKLKGENILIRAHGEPPETYNSIEKNHNVSIEATCPVVLKLQDRIKATHDDGDFILIFGKKQHPEVLGLAGQIGGDYLIFKEFEELVIDDLPDRITLYSQTTMDVDQLLIIAEKLKQAGKEVVLKDTVCRQVLGRKNEIQIFAKKKNIILMVAGKNSSNGQILYEACKLVNSRSYHISSVGEVSPEWFLSGDKVGICGATSTPDWLMKDVEVYLTGL
ncbi:MAG: 4-hydroxy-3-methylbut-2-enyl diphosphate reductase [Bacteroidota bacterium]|nr:4-hydroxy-3-methylbut-2-enyl diphosphate reductase [Bacteroidota bacterium]